MTADEVVMAAVPLPSGSVLHLVCVGDGEARSRPLLRLVSGKSPECREARTVSEALLLIETVRPKAVILDARDNAAFARDVVQAITSERRADAPTIVVVAGSQASALATEFFAAGANGFVLLEEARPKLLHRDSYIGVRPTPRPDERVAEEVAFYSAISHDIRAPLGVILGALSELRHDADDLADHQRKLLELMQRSGERLLGLAQTLTDLGAPPPVHPRFEDVALLAREITDEMAHSWGSRGKAIALEVDGPLVAAIDRQDFGRILTNLLTNALRYARNQVRVVLTMEGHEIVLAIRDDGPGVAADLLPLLFRGVAPRSYTSRTRVGLGLTIVREIAERYHGTASAKNEVEDGKVVGAAFFVRLSAHGVGLPAGPSFFRTM